MGLNKNTLNNVFTAFYFIHKWKVVFDCKYSVRRLIGSWIIESAIYCDQILLVPLYLNMFKKHIGLLNHSVTVMTFMSAQSDSNKW
jgi:hypothetical protein